MLLKLLCNLQAHKAASPDGLLKETATEIAPTILLLFQSSINQGTVPYTWKKGFGCAPIQKGM